MQSPISSRFVPIEAIADIDLERHALIEASAGTGKTYTIENLVLRLLRETPDLKLENILLVTFTEKAASELKQRIHQKLDAALDADSTITDAQRNTLQDALDSFDNAAIFTIHGFCHTLLREFPFETGNLFAQELIDERPLMETLLRAQMRSVWPQRYGRHLTALLDLADFTANPGSFIDRTIDLAGILLGDPAHETVIPDPGSLDLEDLLRDIGACIESLRGLVGSPPALVDGYQRLNINSRTRAALVRDVVQPIETIATLADPDHLPLDMIMSLVDTLCGRHSSGEVNLDRLIPQKWLKAGENLTVCPNLGAIREQLVTLITHVDALSHLLMLESVDRLRRDTAAAKAQHGWISYQDMLSRVAAFLDQPDSATGIGIIRKRYRVAFVDEFQDTDILQWRIFSTLFLADQRDASQNRLFLIGDPKQAIYGFRGADVFTYLTARARMMALAGRGRANLYMLAQNWRSLPDLVGCFNRIFGQDAWFGSPDGNRDFAIGYTPSGSPPEGALPLSVARDESLRPVMNVIDLSEASGHAAAKTMLAEFICREIRYLVDGQPIRLAGNDAPARPLNFRDVAILVRSQGEFSVIEPQLDQFGIPFTYYRKPGLFQSREAAYLSMVLHAVAAPQETGLVRRALLTPFFDIPPHALAAVPVIPESHPSLRLIARCHTDGQKRRWGALFQTLMEASGMILRHCNDTGWQRMDTNLRQLFDVLEVAAYTQNLDLPGLVAHLDGLRLSDRGAGGDADIHQIEDDGDKVQVLTMHVSKGLEFPVVFIAGGLTERGPGGLRIYHETGTAPAAAGCKKVIDLTGRTGQEAFLSEYLDENKRIYYVALTRAKLKLYLPYYPSDRKQTWIGPVSRFISPCLDQAHLRDSGRGSRVGWHDGARHRTPSARRHPEGQGPFDSAYTVTTTEPILPPDHDFGDRRVALESFSSLVHRSHASPSDSFREFGMTDEQRRDDDEPDADAPPVITEAADSLPGGADMGSMFHHVFENIDFSAVLDGPADILDDPSIARIIAHAADMYRVDRSWLSPIGAVVADTLRSPMAVNGASLVLGALTPAQRRHEMEFFFPLAPGPFPDVTVSGCRVTGMRCNRMVLRGFIDLVFKWRGRFYIADWKSNRLAAGYDQPAMDAEMSSAGYTLQARLYAVATLRWLRRQLGDRFDPQRQFGGVLYLFLRGIKPEGGTGVYHIAPEVLLPLDVLQETIQKTIAGER